MMALATMALAFTSCEDVPMPYEDPNANTDQPSVVTPAGEGTVESPYNIAMAQKLITDGTAATTKVYVRGYVVSVDIDTNYGNATYYLSDSKNSSAEALEVYRGYSYNGDKFTSTDELKVGDDVVVYGVLVNYNGTHEITQGSQIYSINGVTKEVKPGADPKGTGTEADPYNVAKAQAVAAALDADTKVENVYIKGIISEVKSISTQYGNAEYYISDDGTTDNQFLVYRGFYLDGQKFTSEDQIKKGDEVVILGTLVNFKGNTPEVTTGSKIVSLNGNGGGSTAKTGLEAAFKDGMDGFTIKDLSLGDGLNYVWKHDASHGYMKASAYKGGNIAAQSMLISPAFSLEGLSKATVSFDHTGKYFGTASEECKVLASTDGENWTELPVSAYPDGSNWNFVSATCDLSAFAGKSVVYIAFQYTSTADAAPTWEIKNVVVK